MRSRLDPDYGDLSALRAKMVVWAKGMTRNAPHAEDLVQAALLKMLANRHLAPPLAQVDPWTRRVLLNTVRDERRASTRQPVTVDLDDVPLAASDNPETQTYCRQVFRMCLGLDPSLLLDPESNGQRWLNGTAKTVTERRRRYRARLKLQQVAA